MQKIERAAIWAPIPPSSSPSPPYSTGVKAKRGYLKKVRGWIQGWSVEYTYKANNVSETSVIAKVLNINDDTSGVRMESHKLLDLLFALICSPSDVDPYSDTASLSRFLLGLV